jgi:DnaJ-class molecular chaperone
MTHKYYDVLGVQKGCSKDDIRRAYKKLAVQMHPDKGGDPEKFKELANAYDVLSDDNKRNQYDQLGDTMFHESGGGAGHPGGFPGGIDPQSIFEQFFGGGGGGFHFHRGPPMQVKKNDHNHEIGISLSDAYHGVQKTVKVCISKMCRACRETCNACQGKGSVMDMRRMGFLTQMMERPCDACDMTGFTVKPKQGCGECSGHGHTKTDNRIELQIPPGVQHGHTMVIPGLGDQALRDNEISGDLVFHIHVQKDPVFVRQGNNLVMNIPVSFVETMVGKEVNVPHFAGSFTVHTADFGVVQPDHVYKVQGKGMPNGDLHMVFKVAYPSKKLSQEERDTLQAVCKKVGL